MVITFFSSVRTIDHSLLVCIGIVRRKLLLVTLETLRVQRRRIWDQWGVLRIISCAFFLKELFVRANRKCIFTGNYVTRGKTD